MMSYLSFNLTLSIGMARILVTDAKTVADFVGSRRSLKN